MIEETRNRLTALTQELEQAKEKAADLKNSAVAVQKEYDKIMSWADLYAGSSIEEKDDPAAVDRQGEHRTGF